MSSQDTGMEYDCDFPNHSAKKELPVLCFFFFNLLTQI